MANIDNENEDIKNDSVGEVIDDNEADSNEQLNNAENETNENEESHEEINLAKKLQEVKDYFDIVNAKLDKVISAQSALVETSTIIEADVPDEDDNSQEEEFNLLI